MWVFGFLCLCSEVRNVGIWFLVTMLLVCLDCSHVILPLWFCLFLL